MEPSMTLIYIDEGYTDFLRMVEPKVPYNMNYSYQRPFAGVLINVQNMKYFAPLTTSSKGKKLMQNPKPESVTFLPIENCKFGGINFNNMLPVVEGVYEPIDLTIYESDTDIEKKNKIKYIQIVRFLRKNKDKIILKAKMIYNMQKSGTLYPWYEKVTCDFSLLEEQCQKWNLDE